jgi:hypothetical protein
VAFAVGKWTQETCKDMIEQLYRRTELPSPDRKMDIFTDGNDDYTYVLAEYYPDTCINYGQLVKIKENGKLVGKEKRTIYGSPDPGDIETTDIENFNGILRERSGRLVRKTKCFSKYKRRVCYAVHLFQFYWDFINEFKRDASPAVLEGVTDHMWSWHDFLIYHYAV